MPAPPNHVFTVFAFISFFLCLIRFPMQLHAWNVGSILFLAWIGLSCLSLGINSIIWNHNTVNWAPLWCDISSRFNVGISIAIPAVVLSINRRLYLLASPTSVLPSEEDKRREIMIDVAIGIGLPTIVIVFSYFVQGARFAILEDIGCCSGISSTWVTLIIVSVPPIILEIIAGVYGCLSIRAFYKRSSQLKESLSSYQNLNSNRYLRLICFSTLDLIIGTPIAVAYLYFSITDITPFPGLTAEHSHLSQVIEVPAVVWRATTITELAWELNRWLMVWSAFVFFAIFGFTQEARNNYRAALRSVFQVFMKITGIKSRPNRQPAEELTFKVATCKLPLDTFEPAVFSYTGKATHSDLSHLSVIV